MKRTLLASAAACLAVAGRSAAEGEALAPSHPPGLESSHALSQLHLVFRHGARAPLSTRHGSGEEVVASCPRLASALVEAVGGGARPAGRADARQQATTLPGGCHLGQLSDVGWAQALALGAAERERYLPLLEAGLPTSPPALSVRSSNLQRTVATARGVLEGLYGGSPPAEVAVRVAPDELEWLYPNTDGCARLRRLWRARGARAASPEAEAALRARWATALARLEPALPPPDSHAGRGLGWAIVELLDHAASRAAHGAPPLPGVDAEALEELRAISASVVASMFEDGPGSQSGEGLRLSIGRLLAQLLREAEAAAGGASPLRLSLSGAHDTTLLPLLLALRGVPGPDEAGQWLTWPPYTSCMAFELWSPRAGAAEAAHYVRVLHDGRAVPMACAQAAHGGACRLADFSLALRRLVPVDFAAECEAGAAGTGLADQAGTAAQPPPGAGAAV